MRAFAFALTLCLSLAVQAAGPAYTGSRTDYDRHMGEGIRLYDKLEYEDALRELRDARADAPSADDAVRASLYEGIVLADDGQLKASDGAFKTALEMDPDAVLPIQTVAPKTAKRFENVRKQVKKKLGAKGVETLRAEKQARVTAPPPAPTHAETPPLDAPRVTQTHDAPSPPVPSMDAAPSAATQPVAVRPSVRAYAWIPAVAGVVVAGGATGLYFAARGNYLSLVNGTVSSARAEHVAQIGQRQQIASYALFGVAGAALLSAGGMALFGGPRANAPQPSAWMAPGSGGVALSGDF